MRTINTKISLLIFTIVQITFQLTSSPSVQPNPIYGDAGSFSFTTSTYYNTVTTTLSPATFTLTFTNRTSSTTNYNFGYTIQEINYQITNNKINYSLIINGTKTATSIQALLYTNNANKISVLNINYVIIEPLFGVYYFSYPWIFPGVNLINGQFYSYSQTAKATLNTTGGLKIWKTIVGVDASLAANRQIDLYLDLGQTSSSTIVYKISTASPTSFFLTSIVVGAYAYNFDQLNNNNRTGRFPWGSFGSVSNVAALTFADSTKSVRTYNTILGISSYHIANQNILHYKCVITPNNTISAASTYPFNYMEFNYIILNFVYCNSATTPYLLLTTSTCYDACPIRYSSNTYSQCTACSNYRCFYCSSNNSCSQCSSGADFRVLNSTTMDCDPMTGYYDNGVSIAVPCNPANCLTCTSNTFCLSCASGKYLTGSNTCVTCPSTCVTCTSATACQSCITYYGLSGGSCTINCTITNCVTCAVVSSSLTCSTCVSNYYYNNGSSCTACPSNCVTCTASACQTCATYYGLSGGSCSINCTITNCVTCAIVSSSLTCSTCASAYYYINGSSCTACPTICLTCTAAACQSCVTFYGLSSGSCVINCTITNCATCTVVSSSLSCSSCVSGYYYTNGSSCNSVCGDAVKVSGEGCDDGNTVAGDGCSSNCSIENGYYCVLNGSKSKCQTCSNNCLSCTASNDCNTCANNYYFSNSQLKCIAKCTSNCSNNCGNGILQGTEKCDDGNSNNYDGCSSTCLIQTYYACAQNSALTSICNIQNLTTTKTVINKDKTSNSVTLCTQLTPSFNPSYTTVNWSSVIAQKSLLNVTFSSFQYSSVDSSLCFTFQYFSDISKQILNVGFSFPVTAPFALLTNVSASFYLVSDNNLALKAYSNDAYTLANILRIVVKGLCFILLFFLMVGMIRYKIIPLETSAVFQIAGFSLLVLSDLSPTLSALDEISFICQGYRFTFFSQSVALNRRFSPLAFSFNFANNFNFLGMVIMAMLIIGGIVYLVNGCMSIKKKGCEKVANNLLCEYSVYVLMFSSYQIMISAAISAQEWSSATLIENAIFLAGSGVFVLLIIGYCIAEVVKKGVFGGDDQFFKHQSSYSNYFYCLIVLQKMLVSLCLSFLVINYQLSLALVPFLFLLYAVITKKPYARNSGNFRPGFNYSMMIIILCLMVVLDGFKDSLDFSIYGPAAVVFCLAVCLIGNIIIYLYPFFRKNKQVLPIDSFSFDYSKRKMQKSKELSDVDTYGSSFHANNSKKEKDPIVQNEYEPEDVIDQLNSNFVIQNPVIHAFRTSNRKKKAAPKKDREKSAVVDELLVLQESLAQIRENSFRRRQKREQESKRREMAKDGSREELESIQQQ